VGDGVGRGTEQRPAVERRDSRVGRRVNKVISFSGIGMDQVCSPRVGLPRIGLPGICRRTAGTTKRKNGES
jgi:hypothetical protein